MVNITNQSLHEYQTYVRKIYASPNYYISSVSRSSLSKHRRILIAINEIKRTKLLKQH